MSRELRRAFLFGLLPLCGGLGILALWMATRWDALPVLGGLTLIVGPVFVLVGALNLRAATGAPRRRRLAALLVLCANLPAAAFALWAAEGVMSSFTVTVRNESPRILREVVAVGPGIRERLGTLAPGETRTVRIVPQGPSSLQVEWLTEAGWQRADGDIYMTAGLEGHVEFVVRARGPAVVHHSSKSLGWFQSAPW